MVTDSGMVYAPNNKVYMAFHQVSATLRGALNGNEDAPGCCYAGAFLVGAYDMASNTAEWVKENRYFGYSSSIVYKNYGPTGLNLFIGGA